MERPPRLLRIHSNCATDTYHQFRWVEQPGAFGISNKAGCPIGRDGDASQKRAVSGKNLGTRWRAQFESFPAPQVGRIWALAREGIAAVSNGALSDRGREHGRTRCTVSPRPPRMQSYPVSPRTSLPVTAPCW